MSREVINPFAIHVMVRDVIEKIDENQFLKKQFQFEPLFINIYYCFYFVKFLNSKYLWKDEIIKLLKRNITKKWLNCLPNVDFFIKQIEIKNQEIDPFDYWFHSEDYFQKLIALKEIADVLFPAKKKKKKKKYVKKYKLIR